MRSETLIFGCNALFFGIVTPVYWFMSYDPTGTAALTMTFLLTTLVTFYLGFHATHMEPRPEDRKQAEIADGAGELGFFPPYSWWPLWCAATLGMCVLGIVYGWWLFIIGVAFGSLAVSGWIYEYYRGDYAH